MVSRRANSSRSIGSLIEALDDGEDLIRFTAMDKINGSLAIQQTMLCV
jgi:hypothetical protein